MVYRRYAGLFFCVCVDANDNELAYLEAIHFFVEVLDQFFGNVCELDLVFNFYKVWLGNNRTDQKDGYTDWGYIRSTLFWTKSFSLARLRKRVSKWFSRDSSIWTNWSER